LSIPLVSTSPKKKLSYKSIKNLYTILEANALKEQGIVI